MAMDERTPLLRSGAEFEPVSRKRVHDTKWRKELGIVVALLGVFVAGADQSFIMVTYEMIASHFGDVSDSAWVLSGYNLGYCVALPVYGKISDGYGRQIPLVTSYCLFSIGCMISGTGIFLWQVIAGRIITGFGGAGMVALVSVIITENVLPNQVALLRSYVSVFHLTGRAFGGPIGALITDAIGWRWSFIFQAPLALLSCVVCIILLSSGQQVENKVENTHVQKSSSQQNIDYLGIGALSIIITSLLTAIECLGKEGTNVTTSLILIGIAFCFSILFLLIEAYHTKQPLIPLTLLKSISGIYFVVQIILFVGGQAHVSSLAPYFLRTQDLDTTTTALHVVPSPLGFTVGSFIAGYIIQKTSRYKALCVTSLVLVVFTYLIIAIRWGNEPSSLELLYIFPVGLGFGAVLACTFTAQTTSSPKTLQATSICLYYLCQQIGGIFGIGLSSVAMHKIFKETLEARLEGIPNEMEVIQKILNNSSSLSLPEAFRSIVHMSYRHSFQIVSFLPCLATALALPLVLLAFKAQDN